jgi:NAD dependent epimerase/dehydratase family enzyme
MRDTVRLIEFALKNDEVQGPMNVVSPNPTTNREFYKILGKVKGRPVLGAMPSAILRKIVGPFSEAILASQRVVPAKALDHGFQFEDTDIAKLLSEQLSKKRQGGKDKNSGK